MRIFGRFFKVIKRSKRMGQHTFRNVVKPKQLLVTTDLAGTLTFTDRATSFKITSGQSLALASTDKTEHLIEGQSVEIWNAGTSDIIISGTLMQSGVAIDIEPGTSSVLIWTSIGLFVDLGGSALIKDVEEDLSSHVSDYDAHDHDGTTAPRIQATDLAHTGASNSDLLRLVGGTLTWTNPFDGVRSDLMQVSNTDSTTNINAASWTVAPINGVVVITPQTSYLSSATNGIQVNFNGIVKARTNVYQSSSVTRSNVEIAFAVNGTKVPGIAASGYIRNSSGHNTSSCYIEKAISVSSGDIITIQTRQGGATGTVTMPSSESYLEVEIPADTMSQGPQGPAGYAGWDYLYGTIVPASGLGSDGDVYLRTATSDFYKKESGTWNLIANLKGAAGTDGAKTDLVFAEENANLGDNTLEWSFGNGAVSNGSTTYGVAMPYDGEVIGMTLAAESAPSSTCTVEVLINGASVSRSISLAASVGAGTVDFTGNTVSFDAGDVIGFRTVLGGSASDARVCAVVEFD